MEMENVNKTSITNLSGTVTELPRINFHARLQQLFDALKRECYKRLEHWPLPTGDGLYCVRTVDLFGGCWNDSPAGSIASIECPELPRFNTKEHAYKECTINGTWFVNGTTGREWANYSACEVHDKNEDHKNVIYIFVGGFSLSLLMLILSLFIFFRYRQLHCDRITIHKNLFISYVFTGLAWLLYYLLVTLDGDIQLENPVWCQMLHLVTEYFTMCNFQWMFCEGLYLHTVILYAFNTGKAVVISCHVIGWSGYVILLYVTVVYSGHISEQMKDSVIYLIYSLIYGPAQYFHLSEVVPFVLTVIYAGIRGWMQSKTTDCWIHESSLKWIMHGPTVVSIGVNVIFLANIVRLLVRKLKGIPEVTKIRNATRATLILIPLLGLQYVPFKRPEKGSPLEEVYHIAVALVVSLQGAVVSLIYCFCNGEVKSLLRRKWKQHRLMKGVNMWSFGHCTSTRISTTGSSSHSCRSSLSSSVSKKNESDLNKLKTDNK